MKLTGSHPLNSRSRFSADPVSFKSGVGVHQGPGGKCAIRCSICSPTRLRGSRGRIWGAPDEKGSIFDHLGVFLVSKMGFLRSGTDPICFKFESDVLKMKEFQFSLDYSSNSNATFCFSGSAGEGAALSNPPTPRDEGGGVRVNKKAHVRR